MDKPRGGISKFSSKLPNTKACAPIGGVSTCHEVAVKLIFFLFSKSHILDLAFCAYSRQSLLLDMMVWFEMLLKIWFQSISY